MVLTVSVLIARCLATGSGSLMPFVSSANRLLGGIWTIAAVVFVYREGLKDSAISAIVRIGATGLSVVLVLVHFLLLPLTW